MRKLLTSFFAAALATLMFVSCATGTQTKQTMKINNELSAEEIAAGILTPEVIWKMGRIGGYSLSPDGATVVYAVTDYSVEQNRGNGSLWLMPAGGGQATLLSDGEGSDSSPKWSSDGKRVYFSSSREGSSQLWSIDPQSRKMEKLTNVEGGIEGFGVAPTGDRVFYIKGVRVEDMESKDVYADMDKSKALIYSDLMVRHWDYWDRGSYSHIFIATLGGAVITEGEDIMAGEAWDAPMAPYFDNSEISWSNDGTKLAYTCKKMVGTEYALSTNSDIYIYDVASKITSNITEGMVGYDKYPVFSPDDSKVAFTSMARPGNESDKPRLFVHDLATKQNSYLTANFDYNASNTIWDGESSILFVAPIEATHQVCRATLDGVVSVLTRGDHDINSFDFANSVAVCGMTKISMATELFNLNIETGVIDQISTVNNHIYENITLGDVQKRWVTTTDNKKMLTWVVLPPNFDPNKKYPTLLYCQGGPQSVVSQFWSFRWNLQLMAAQGYIVVAPNRRGLPSFGQEWLDQISGDYSGQNIRDYLSAIDDVSREPWVDRDRLGCIGASYGGYSVFFLAGNHDKRFKAFISHCGIFNFESMYGATEELFFVNNDYGGSYWSKNPVAKRSYANSPHKFVDKWDTPILIYAGLNDFRIPYSQSLEAFTAARLKGIPSRLVAFENEAHQVFQPQNSMVWNREFFGWLDKHVKGAK